MNGLSQPDFVSEQQPGRGTANDCQRRLELEWKDVDVGRRCRAQLSECMQASKMSVQPTHPIPACDRTEFLRAMCRDWPVKRGKETASPRCGVMLDRTGELEERDVWKRDRLLDEPSFAAHRDAIAGRK